MEKTKVCGDCGRTLPLSSFASRPNRNKTATRYHCSYCRACMVRRTEAWKERNAEKFESYQEAYKTKRHEAIGRD